MPTQKLFKRRVRARMAKTGESYTAARHQLLRKAGEMAAVDSPAPSTDVPAEAMQVSDEAMRRATGKSHAEWFALLDAWGATRHMHTEIAQWLSQSQGVPGWWTQSVTVAYERARGMRATHQMADGFNVSATRTVGAFASRALEAFTDERIRERWLPGAPMRQRPTRAALTARFDWAEPPSRVVVIVDARDDGRSTVSVTHERVPDAAAADGLKRVWRERLGDLKALLERD